MAVFQRDENFPLEKDGLINLSILGVTAEEEGRKKRGVNLVNARRLMSIYVTVKSKPQHPPGQTPGISLF